MNKAIFEIIEPYNNLGKTLTNCITFKYGVHIYGLVDKCPTLGVYYKNLKPLNCAARKIIRDKQKLSNSVI